MANFNDQVMIAWEEWAAINSNEANDPDDFIDWAIENRKFVPKMEDLRKIYRRSVSRALRQVHAVDDQGTSYRKKQCVSIVENGKQRTLWFDVDLEGTPSLRRKAARQRRDGIANDVYRAMSDVTHMNYAFPKDEKIQFEMDFTEDYEERKALEALELEKKDSA